MNIKTVFGFSILFFLIIGQTNKASSQILVNKVWQINYGIPDLVDWSATVKDDEDNFYMTGNNLQYTQMLNILTTKYDRDGNIVWQVQYNDTSNNNDFGTAITIDDNGNVYIAGAVFDTGTNSYDYIIIEYDDNGNFQWAKKYNGDADQHDIPTSIAIDDNGNIYVTGSSIILNEMNNFATLKYDNNGNFQWLKLYDESNLDDFPISVEIINNGDNIVVTGACAISSTDWNIIAVEYDENGNYVDKEEITTIGAGFDEPTAVVKDITGNFFITGITSSNGINYNIKTVKIDTSFNIEWEVVYDPYGKNDKSNSIVLDMNGNVLVCGYVTDQSNIKRSITLKYDPSGNMIWSKELMSTFSNGDCEGIRLVSDSASNIFITGNMETSQNMNLFTIQYDTSGEIRWFKGYNSIYNFDDYAHDIALGNNQDNIYVMGKLYDGQEFKYFTVKYEKYERDITFEYDTNNMPLYIKDEIIIRFDTSAIIKTKIDDKEILYGSTYDFIKTELIEVMEELTEIDYRTIKLIKIFNNLTTLDTISISRLGEIVTIPPFWATFRMVLPTNADESEICDTLKTLFPNIRYTHLNYTTQLQSSTTPNDSLYPIKQKCLWDKISYPYGNINIEEAWEYETGKEFIKVGIYDGGIEWYHEDFGGYSNSRIIGGYDYHTNSPFPNISYFGNHGTRVAGIVGAIRNNNIGVSGIAGGNDSLSIKGVSLFDYKMIYYQDGLSITDRARAIQEGSVDYDSVTNLGGLYIMNHSWGGNLDSAEILEEQVRFAFKNQVVFVASRGNKSHPTHMYVYWPACYRDDWVINVGAADADDGSNMQMVNCDGCRSLDVMAPGDHTKSDYIYTTTINNIYDIFGYTSGAAPHVSGLASLMLSYLDSSTSTNTNLAPEDVETIIELSPSFPSIYPYSQDTGWGLINAGNALKMLEKGKYQIIHKYKKIAFDTTVFSVDTANVTIMMDGNFKNLQNGTLHSADIYKISVTDNFILDSNYVASKVWVRNSSSNLWGWKNNGKVSVEDSIVLDTFNSNSINMTGYVFLIDTIWAPIRVYDTIIFAYTIYAYDSTLVDISEYSKNNFSVGLNNPFPNPSNGYFQIEYYLDKNQYVELNLFNICGQNVKTIYKGNQKKGRYYENIDISNFLAGIYIVYLYTYEGKDFKKIIKY